MKLFKIIFWVVWRCWLYVLVLAIILVMSPILIISTLKQTWYPYFFKLARIWAKIVFYGMGFRPKVSMEEKINPKGNYMIIANHTSMMDIMLLLIAIKNPFVFVGKKELASIPVFGFFYKRTCIVVDRSSPKSRQAVYEAAKKRIKQGMSICIFPEGKVPDDESVVLDVFKDGAFNLSLQHNLPIIPIVFPDNKKHFSYTFMSGMPGKLRIKILAFIPINTSIFITKDIVRDHSWKLIYDELVKLEKQ